MTTQPPNQPRGSNTSARTQAEPLAFDAEFTKEQIRYAPHLLFIRQAQRVDEAMAAGLDPYPAFCAWQSALAPWAWDDPAFLQQAQLLDALLDEVYRTFGAIPRLEYVRAWRPLYFGVMRRAGMFPRMDATPPRSGASLDRIRLPPDPTRTQGGDAHAP
jgi:hypothetical protein